MWFHANVGSWGTENILKWGSQEMVRRVWKGALEDDTYQYHIFKRVPLGAYTCAWRHLKSLNHLHEDTESRWRVQFWKKKKKCWKSNFLLLYLDSAWKMHSNILCCIGLLHLKFSHPSVEAFGKVYHRGSVNFKWFSDRFCHRGSIHPI